MKQFSLFSLALILSLLLQGQEQKSLPLKSAISQDSYLDANNIKALVSAHGLHFFNNESASFEYPKGSGKHVASIADMILGARVAGSHTKYLFGNFRGSFSDKQLHTGPVSNNYSNEEREKWGKGTWKITRYDVDYHKENWQMQGYQPSEAILTWPANGNTDYGQMPVYAPFYDRDRNGIYEPLKGDYPEIRGDQCIFFVYTDSVNDFNLPENGAMGLEVLGMAYAYDMVSNSVLHNSIFFHYDIVNRSSRDYTDVYTGFLFNGDIGDYNDDYFGTDVENGMIYIYNGDSIDGDGQDWTYGVNPPAVGMKIIGGPYLPADGIDNPTGQCSYDINGLNFGDEIVDNERYGLTNSIYPNVSGVPWPNEESNFNYMRGQWGDGSYLSFGGYGRTASGAVGPNCRFMFPDVSDTLCNWGTNGVMPNGGYNQNGYFWNEETTDYYFDDRRGIGSIGPFNLKSGESIPLDIAFTVSQSDKGALMSKENLKFNARYIGRNAKDILCSCGETYGNEDNSVKSFNIFPNPAKNQVLVFSEYKNPQEYRIYNLTGSLVQTGLLVQGNNQLNITALKPGLYLIKSAQTSTKIIVTE